jgi:hypothetical protein
MQKQERLKNYSLARSFLIILMISAVVSLINSIQYELKARNDKEISGFQVYENRVDIFNIIVNLIFYISIYVLVGRLL